MSKFGNNLFFDVIEEIENEPEDYNRNHSRQLLMEYGCSFTEAEKLLDDIEENWDMRAEYIAEQIRENAQT